MKRTTKNPYRRKNRISKPEYKSVVHRIGKQIEMHDLARMNGLGKVSLASLKKRLNLTNVLMETMEMNLPSLELVWEYSQSQKKADELRREIERLKRDVCSRSNIFKTLLGGPVWSDEDKQKIDSLKFELSGIKEKQRPSVVAGDFVGPCLSIKVTPHYVKEAIKSIKAYSALIRTGIEEAETRVRLRENAAKDRKLALNEKARVRHSIREKKEAQMAEKAKAIEQKLQLKRDRDAAHVAAVLGKSRRHARAIRNKISKQTQIIKECPYCGIQLCIDESHADHIYPVSHGGLSVVGNMVFVCRDCNKKKSDMTLREFVSKFTNLDRNAIERRLEILKKKF